MQIASKHKSVAIISKPDKPELVAVVSELLGWLAKRGYEVVADQETASYASSLDAIPRTEIASRPLDFVVVLGGDGTLLSAARAVAQAEIPVLGVNLGSLGFLTEVPLAELYPTLQAIEDNRHTFELRSLLHGELVRKGQSLAAYEALNDIVVNKTAIARLNHYDLYIDRVFVSGYKADGMIVATPTGSTAYSLAAGGPILTPSVEAFIVTPVSPHSLTHRPLVVPDSAEIEISVQTHEEAYLSVDGQVGVPVYGGDHVVCRRSKHQVKLLRIQGTFFDVLRTKLKWGQR
jgi:NAD+ kinase